MSRRDRRARTVNQAKTKTSYSLKTRTFVPRPTRGLEGVAGPLTRTDYKLAAQRDYFDDPFATGKDRLIMTCNALIKAHKQTGRRWKGSGRAGSESDIKEKRKTIDLARRNVVDLLRSTGSAKKKEASDIM